MHTIALKFYCILLLIFISHNINGKEQHNEKINIDLIVEAKHILTMDASNTILENSSIAINEGLIIEIADIRQINAKYTSDNHILGQIFMKLPPFWRAIMDYKAPKDEEEVTRKRIYQHQIQEKFLGQLIVN